MTSKKAIYIQAKVRELFPPDDPAVPSLLRLMAAVNDLRTLQKLWFYAHTRVGNTPCEQDIIKAEDRYIFSLTCATVYEAALAFQDLRRVLTASAAQDTIKKMPHEAPAAFYALENIFPDDFESRPYGKVLVKLRNSIFHYVEPRVFRSKLEKHDELGSLIIGDVVGASRYLLADDLEVQILARLLGGSFEDELYNLMNLVLRVTDYFGTLVDGVVWLFIQDHEGALVEQREDIVDLERLWNITPEHAQGG